MIQCTALETDLLFARPLAEGNGYSWTLASRLGAMLQSAQEQFGARDMSYTILGFEFCGSVPQIWYPGNCRNIVIQLTPACATDLIKACYQLSHECIHLLAPSGGQNANNLEEGLATHFCHRYIVENFGVDFRTSLQSYAAARAAVEELVSADATVIRRLRERQPAIYQRCADDIIATVPNTRPELAAFLCERFTR
jgi:hypothetical protein